MQHSLAAEQYDQCVRGRCNACGLCSTNREVSREQRLSLHGARLWVGYTYCLQTQEHVFVGRPPECCGHSIQFDIENLMTDANRWGPAGSEGCRRPRPEGRSNLTPMCVLQELSATGPVRIEQSAAGLLECHTQIPCTLL